MMEKADRIEIGENESRGEMDWRIECELADEEESGLNCGNGKGKGNSNCD